VNSTSWLCCQLLAAHYYFTSSTVAVILFRQEVSTSLKLPPESLLLHSQLCRQCLDFRQITPVADLNYVREVLIHRTYLCHLTGFEFISVKIQYFLNCCLILMEIGQIVIVGSHY